MTNAELKEAVSLVKKLRKVLTCFNGLLLSKEEALLLFKAVDQIEAAVKTFKKENA